MSSSQGFSISNPNTGMSFNHPFRPILVGAGNGAGLRFVKGVVDGFEPTINGIPISGISGALAPSLKLTGVTSKTKESWAVLEVTPNARGVLDTESKIQIVHSLAPGGMLAGVVGRQALALIVWNNGTPVMAWPLVFFNLHYVRQTSTTEPTRHFFL